MTENVDAEPGYHRIRSLIASARPAAAPASTATGRFHTRYRNTANTSSAPKPCTKPDSRVSTPH